MKKKLGFWEIWNMSFGFLGIQFGFALQGGFMSRIFQTLGAEESSIPLLWIAAPLTGLIVQPIIGFLSDNTWHSRLGRRKPYFLIGAILSSLALFFVPYSSTLWIAAGFLWILDASINISMEPFRALVADKLPDSQRSYGFVTQTLIIGIGTWIASNLPYFVSSLGVSDVADPGVIPDSVKVAFAIGAGVFFLSILYTILTTSEYPPKDLKKFRNQQKKDIISMLKEFTSHYTNMPLIMKKLGIIQFFSWFAFFTMWSMANPAITEHVFKSPVPIISEFDLSDKVELEQYTSKKRINRKMIHLWSLILGGIGFISFYFISDHTYLILSFALIGISWGSILSMPYAMLSSSVKEESMGTSMGIFNMFIVIPQIIAAIGGINILSSLIGEEPIFSMIIAGLALIIAGFLNLTINDQKTISN
jgi:maltose/moltooligosaccharide transporter